MISVLISRLYFHAHYFSDVVGGVSLAIIWVSLFILVSPLLNFGEKSKVKVKNLKNIILDGLESAGRLFYINIYINRVNVKNES